MRWPSSCTKVCGSRARVRPREVRSVLVLGRGATATSLTAIRAPATARRKDETVPESLEVMDVEPADQSTIGLGRALEAAHDLAVRFVEVEIAEHVPIAYRA